MSKKKNDKTIKLSFESDGVMGKEVNTNQKNTNKEFFNTTQNSE